jgi:hypothetical protein
MMTPMNSANNFSVPLAHSYPAQVYSRLRRWRRPSYKFNVSVSNTLLDPEFHPRMAICQFKNISGTFRMLINHLSRVILIITRLLYSLMIVPALCINQLLSRSNTFPDSDSRSENYNWPPRGYSVSLNYNRLLSLAVTVFCPRFSESLLFTSVYPSLYFSRE